MEDLLFKKEEQINGLEREIKQKEKALEERQEQISVLISTLEGQRTQDELRQKVLDLSAELCAVKAMEAQKEKRLSEVTYILKKSELCATKNLKLYQQEKESHEEVIAELRKVEKELAEARRETQEAVMNADEHEREANDWKYKQERQEF